MTSEAPVNIEGCEEIIDPPSAPGTRTFRCDWERRFAVAYVLLQVFGNVEISGAGPIDDGVGLPIGYHHAVIVAGTRRRT